MTAQTHTAADTPDLEPHPGQHDMTIIFTGPPSCTDRDCEQYYDENGDELDILRCTHLEAKAVCADCLEHDARGAIVAYQPHPCPRLTEETT